MNGYTDDIPTQVLFMDALTVDLGFSSPLHFGWDDVDMDIKDKEGIDGDLITKK